MEQQRDLLQIQNEELGKAHAALEISNQRFSELHEQAPVGYLTLDAQGCIRAMNAEAMRLLGAEKPSVIGKPFLVYVEKEDREKFLEHLWKIRRRPSRIATDLRLATAEARELQVGMTTGRHHDAEGHSPLFLSAIEDVTELGAASADTARLASIVESSQDAIMSFSSDGFLQSWNGGAEKLFGYRAIEIIGRHLSVLAPEDRREENALVLQAAASGERVPPFDTVRMRKDGSPVDVGLSLSPIAEGSRMVAVTAIGRDITRRERAEQVIREGEERFRAVMESAPDAMVIADGEGRIQLVNRQTEELFGYTRRQLIGKNVEMLMPAGVWHGHVGKREHHSAGPSRRPIRTEVALLARRKDGREVPVEIRLNSIQTQRGVLICSVIRDITERKRVEDAIRALNAELEERVAVRTASLLTSTTSLTASVEALQEEREERRRLEQEVIAISEAERRRTGQDLHDDLGQQLAGIRLFSSTLEKKLREQSSPEADYAATISDMLNDALALTRSLARGLQPVMPESGGLMAALRELAARSSDLFHLRSRFVCRRPVQVHDPAVATHLYRIAQEAVTNAAKHGHAKHISILLSSSRKELLLSVNDDGTGMNEAARGHDGMGMRAMNYRAEALGGSLVFRDRPGGGTSVVCTIPTPGRPAPKER